MRYNSSMLTIHKAKTVSAGEKSLLAALKNHTGRAIIIVPDAFTLSLETTIFGEMGTQGTFDVEVMSFARLAAVTLGSSVVKCLSPAGCVMLMEKVVGKYASDLRVYGRVARKPGFAAEIYAAITAIRNSGIGADRLEAAVSKLSGYVKDKTADIVTLYKGYLDELSRSHADSTTWLEALAAEIRKGNAAVDADYFVMDHFDFNAKQMEVLVALMESHNVTVAVAEPFGSENHRVYPSTYRKLIAAAKNAGVKIEKEVTVRETFSPEKKIIADKMFAYAYKEGKSSHVRLVEAKDPEEEVTLLATEIARLVRKKGRRYRDVAVITPSFDEYLPYLERIFDYYDIPFFADARYPLAGCDVFDHILEGFDLVVHNFDKLSVGKYVAHELFTGFSAEEKGRFDDYVTAYGVDRGYFLRPFDLAVRDDDERRDIAERLRSALVSELDCLVSAPTSATVGEYVRIFSEHLKRNGFDGRIADYAEKIHKAGHLKESSVIGQSPEKIMSLLSTLAEIRGEEIVTREEFIFALRSGAEQMKIAALPVSLDCVYFAPMEQAMYAPIPSMFILGAEDGLFPLESVKEGILGMREYTAWQGIDIVVENAGAEELGRNRFHALQLLLRPEYLHVSYSRLASDCVKELSAMFTLDVEKAGDILESCPIDELIPTVKVAENYLAEYSRKEREGSLTEQESAFAKDIAAVLGKPFPLPAYEDMPKRISVPCFFRKEETNVSEIEGYYACPFRHFVEKGLGLIERETARSDARDKGTLIHDCVCRFTKDKANLRSDDETAEKRARKIAETVLAERKYQVFLRSEGEHKIKSLADEAVTAMMLVRRQISSSDFVPTYLEQWFGAGSVLPALDLGDVRLCGKIDRVDLFEKFAAVFDYKTGSSHPTPKDLYFGSKVQLQIYLAVLRALGYTPAASMYFALKSALKGKKEHYLNGQVLSDLHVVLALDAMSEAGDSDLTGLKIDETSVALVRDVTVSSIEMDAMIDYAILLAKKAVADIKDGCVLPSPVKNGENSICGTCKAKSICHYADAYVREPKGTLHAEDLVRITCTEG